MLATAALLRLATYDICSRLLELLGVTIAQVEDDPIVVAKGYLFDGCLDGDGRLREKRFCGSSCCWNRGIILKWSYNNTAHYKISMPNDPHIQELNPSK